MVGQSKIEAQLENNHLLASLPASEYDLLRPDIELMHIPNGQVLWEQGEEITHVYFPQRCILSLITVMADGSAVETQTVGHEGMAGIGVFLGDNAAPSRAMTQVGNEAHRIPTSSFRNAIARSDILRTLLLRYTQVVVREISQSVACNRAHPVIERCARWLLQSHDRAGGDEFQLTQEFLSYMLGVRRASVTVAAGALQEAGLIRYRHGRMKIRDREGLEEASCECYRIMREGYESLISNAKLKKPSGRI